jgi:hypothetical protein
MDETTYHSDSSCLDSDRNTGEDQNNWENSHGEVDLLQIKQQLIEVN